jgi:GTP-binding protein
MISMALGPCTGYSLMALEPRGTLFVEHNTEVYPGMIIGEHSKANDIELNPCKEKKLSNVRNKVRSTLVCENRKLSNRGLLRYDKRMVAGPPRRATSSSTRGDMEKKLSNVRNKVRSTLV